MNKPSALDALLRQYPGLWRGKGLEGAACAAVSSGFEDLDALLPGGGWPLGTTVELRIAGEGIGELRLLMPVMRRLASSGRHIAWVAPPYVPYAPALAATGLDPSTLTVVRPQAPRDILWSMEKLLQSPQCGVVLGWPQQVTVGSNRRLQLAAEAGNSIGFSIRRNPCHAPGRGTTTALQLWRQHDHGPLWLRVLKMRGACRRGELMLAL
jgi:hypothetical protein